MAEVDWSEIEAVSQERAWLLEELPKAKIPFDDFQHAINCNLSPIFQREKSLDEVTALRQRGCDMRCFDNWKQAHVSAKGG